MLLSLAGSHVFIGLSRPPILHVQDAPSLLSDAWTEIAEPEGMGSVGISWETWNYAEPSDEGVQTITRKGNLSPVTTELLFGLALDDPGQRALWAAARSENDFAFRIDLPDGVASRFWVATVVGISEVYEAANTVVRLRASLVINSSVNRGQA